MSKLDGQCQNEAINLEGLTEDELRAVRNDPTTHADVARMCQLQLFSRQERLAGRISNALSAEEKFERLYETLPKHLRW